MAAMLLGIVFLCQPWSEFLHRYSILTIIVGLVGFNVFSASRRRRQPIDR